MTEQELKEQLERTFKPVEDELWLILTHPFGESWITAKAIECNGTFYKVRLNLPGFEGKEAYAFDTPSSIVAKHSSLPAAEAALKRAQSVEQSLRPYWQAALEHEMRVRNMMFDTAHAAAQPLN